MPDPDDLVEAFHAAVLGGRPVRAALIDTARAARSWFALAELLLVVARRYGEDRSAFVQVDAEVARAHDASVRPAACAALEAFGPFGPPDSGRVDVLVDLLPSSSEPAVLAVAALEIAQAIGEVRRDHFDDWFWSTSPRVLRPGRAYPHAQRDPRLSLGPGFGWNTEPAKLPPAFGQVKGLRLAREVARWFDFSVVEFTGAGDPLAALRWDRRPLVVATCHPVNAFEEFETDYDVDTDPRTFRVDGPLNRPRNRWLIRRQIDDAVAAGATVVVVPEYALRAGEDRRDLRSHLDAMGADRPLIVVAGAAHITREPGAQRVNEGEVWAGPHGGVTRIQDKLYPARITYKVPELLGTARFSEEIDPGRVVHVLRTPRWVVAVLICRDVMSEDVVDQLADLGVNLCLVPSSSPHSGSIVSSLATLRTRSQAVTVLANAPAQVEGVGVLDAAFDGPFEHPPGPEVKLASDRPPGPGIWVWRPTPNDRGARWHPTRTRDSEPEEWLGEFTRLARGPAHGDAVAATVADLAALHAFPTATWRDEHRSLNDGDEFGVRLHEWLSGRPRFAPRNVEFVAHSLFVVVRFDWEPGADPGVQVWTTILAQQPDRRWLAIFHDPWGRSVEVAPNAAGPTSPEAWESTYLQTANDSAKENPAARLAAMYTRNPAVVHRPGRAGVGGRPLERILRAVFGRRPEFLLAPEARHRYGSAVVQSCHWRLTDMGQFADESGHSTVVLLADADGSWRCLWDDPWSALSCPLRLDRATEVQRGLAPLNA